MRLILHSLVLLFLLAPTAFCANRYIEAGYPAGEVRWTGKDYEKAAGVMLNNKELPLPTLADPDSTTIFQRMTDPANLAVLENKKTMVTARFMFLMSIDKQVSPIWNTYVAQLDQGKKVNDEVVRLFAFILHLGKHAVLLAEEFVPQMPKDNLYESRRAALKKFQKGIAEIFLRGEDSLKETGNFSKENRTIILTTMREVMPVAKRSFNFNFRHELRGKLAQRLKDAQNPADREMLQAIVDELQYGTESIFDY
jgi:hypothetical protein